MQWNVLQRVLSSSASSGCSSYAVYELNNSDVFFAVYIWPAPKECPGSIVAAFLVRLPLLLAAAALIKAAGAVGHGRASGTGGRFEMSRLIFKA